MNENSENPDVIPFPRKIGVSSRIGMEACLIVALVIMLFFASGVAKDLRDLRAEIALDQKLHEDARKRYSIQAATIMMNLEQAKDQTKLLTQNLNLLTKKIKVTE